MGLAGFGVTHVNAQASATYQSMVQRLAQRFGLKESDVQTVFDSAKNDRMARMQARQEQRLTQEVKDGKITEAQKTAILAKQKDLKRGQRKTISTLGFWAGV